MGQPEVVPNICLECTRRDVACIWNAIGLNLVRLRKAHVGSLLKVLNCVVKNTSA
jgi:hypothetical protein